MPEPLDPEFLFLEEALDAAHMLRVFLPLIIVSWRQKLTSVGVRILRYRPGRAHCVIQYDLAAADGSEVGVYIGKVFAKQRRAEQLHRVLTLLERHLGARNPAPAPLAHVQEGSLVLMHRLPGVPLVQILGGDDAQAAIDASALAAGALSRLHSVPVETGRPGTLADELVRVREHADEFGGHLPAPVAEGQRLLCGIEALAARLPQPGTASLIHGSFRPHEVLIDGQRVSITDLDGWTLGDPARDIGYYLADLWWDSTKPGMERLRPHGDRFLEQYMRVAGREGTLERSVMYEVLCYVRLMLKKVRGIARGRDDAEAAAQTDVLLEQARKRLALLTGCPPPIGAGEHG